MEIIYETTTAEGNILAEIGVCKRLKISPRLEGPIFSDEGGEPDHYHFEVKIRARYLLRQCLRRLWSILRSNDEAMVVEVMVEAHHIHKPTAKMTAPDLGIIWPKDLPGE